MADRLLWLLRHAKTVPDPPPGGGDHERRLAPRGRRDARALAVRLGPSGDHLGLALALPEVILTSSARRTVETTEALLRAWSEPAPEVRRLRALYGADPERVLEEIALTEPTVGSLMVVGHNPTARELAEELLATSDRRGRAEVADGGFPTCSLGIYRLPGDRWPEAVAGPAELVGLFRPPY